MIPLFKVLMHEEAKSLVGEVLDSGYIGQGPKVEEFERGLARELRSPWDILTVNSCTSALSLALKLCHVGPRDEVIVPPMTCAATIAAIVWHGAIPVWADVHPATGIIDYYGVEELITPRTKAVIGVDWGGRRCPYRKLKRLGIPIIADAAHRWETVDQIHDEADFTCWSFQAIKFLTTGDGGAVLTPSHQVERARKLRWFGLDRRSSESYRCKQNIDEMGHKLHMNDVTAAIGLKNMDLARWAVNQQKKNALYYQYNLEGVKRLVLPPFDDGCSYWIYTVLVERRDDFEKAMKDRGVHVSPVHAPCHLHSAFRHDSPKRPLPGVRLFGANNVAIPVGWWLKQEDLDHIVNAVRKGW